MYIPDKPYLLSDLVTTVPQYRDDQQLIERKLNQIHYAKETKEVRQEHLIQGFELPRLQNLSVRPNSGLRPQDWSSKFASSFRSRSTPSIRNISRHSRLRRQMGRWIYETTIHVLNRWHLI